MSIPPFFSSGVGESNVEAPNPNPNDFNILKIKEINAWVIAEVHYPQCTTYNGRKLLMFRASANEVVSQEKLDPHFLRCKNTLSPMARFEPTPAGWAMAEALAKEVS